MALAMAANEESRRMQIEELTVRKQLRRLVIPNRSTANQAAHHEDGGGKRVSLEHRQRQPEGLFVSVVESDGEAASFARLSGAQGQINWDAQVRARGEPRKMTLEAGHRRADPVRVVTRLVLDDAVVHENRH